MASDPNQLAGKTVLVVEDDASLREMYGTAFRLAGADVMSAENGEDGLLQLRDKKANVIVFDIMMPKMNGHEFIRTVKSFPELEHIPLIALTNLDAHPEYLKEATGVQVEEYLVKANTALDELIKIVKKYTG